jgi:hypothetical protein
MSGFPSSRLHRWLVPPALIVLALGIMVLAWAWFAGTPARWATGDPKLGDLVKHSAAAEFTGKGRILDLYAGSHLGTWILYYFEGKEGVVRDYDYVYPPLVARMAWLLGAEHIVWFSGFWMAVMVAAFMASLILLHRQIPLSGWGVVPWLYAASCPAFFYGVVLGQNHTLSLLILVSVGLLLREGKPWMAGLVWSCLWYKPQLALALAGLMLIFGQGRFAVAAVAGLIGWLALGILSEGIEAHRAWWGVLQQMADGKQSQVMNFNQTWLAWMQTMFPGVSPLMHKAAAFFPCAALLGGGWWLARRSAVAGLLGPEKIFYLVAALWTVISPYVMHYDLLMGLPWCLVLLELPGKWGAKGAWALLFWGVALYSFNFADCPVAWDAWPLSLWLAGSAWVCVRASRAAGTSGEVRG